jgi:6-phosphofructokinase 1
MKSNILIVHGGAPTAVMNASLYGVIQEVKKHKEIEHLYAAIGGTKGILDENFLDLLTLTHETISLLPSTPSSFIGTSRYHLEDSDYERMAQKIIQYHITGVLFNGGNGSMDACGKLSKALKKHKEGLSINVVGIPKTVDNDIAITDHAPGFGSAARYLASTVQELSHDVASLPIHVSIIESMGRNAGWLTASSILAKKEGSTMGPHLIYLPEVPFIEDDFLQKVEELYKIHGGVVVVASEGLRNPLGEVIVPPIFKVGRSLYYGDVSAHLSNLVVQRLGYKARSEKPGILGRSSIAFQSSTDREEAIQAGEESVKAILNGLSEVMIGFERISTIPYKTNIIHIPIEEVMLHEKMLDLKFIDKEHTSVTDEFKEWVTPLIGEPLTTFAHRE